MKSKTGNKRLSVEMERGKILEMEGEKEKCWGPALVGSRDSLRMTALAIRIAIA